MAHVRAVRIPLVVGVRVVLAVVCDPVQQRPWTAIEPNTANAYSTGLGAWKERCVSIRWKPMVTPNPVSTYMTARMARSVALTTLFHSSKIAAIVPANGSATANRFTRFSRVLIPISLSSFSSIK